MPAHPPPCRVGNLAECTEGSSRSCSRGGGRVSHSRERGLLSRAESPLGFFGASGPGARGARGRETVVPAGSAGAGGGEKRAAGRVPAYPPPPSPRSAAGRRPRGGQVSACTFQCQPACGHLVKYRCCEIQT